MGDDLRYWVGFNRISGVGAARFKLLLEAFGDLESAWKATAAELRNAGLGQKTIQSILSNRDEMDLDRELERIYKQGFCYLRLTIRTIPPGSVR